MRKSALIALAVFVALGLVIGIGLHVAGNVLKQQIETALGKDSQVGDISLGLFAVTISDLRIKAPAGWPAEDALRAKRIVVTPDWRALLSRRIALHSINVDGAYMSLWRAPDGKLRLLPSLLEQAPKQNAAPLPDVRIAQIVVDDASIDFFDSTVRRPAHRIRLENVHASLDALHLPALDGESAFELSGLVKGADKGKSSDGRFDLQGNIELATKDSDIVTQLRGVDLIALQPYLIKAADAGVKRGTLDLDLRAKVEKRHLNAPGVITLHDLVLAEDGGFLGMPRQAAVGALKDGGKDIRVNFTLDGNLDDPRFSLNENLAMRFGAGLADTLGVSIGNLGKSVGGAAASVGNTLKGLFSHH